MLKKTLIFLLFIIILLLVGYFSLAAKYKYDVTQDYQYAINNSKHTSTEVLVKQGKFTLNSPKKWDTGFIRLKLEATITGYFAEPYVEIISAQKRSILSFERGVQGRYTIVTKYVQKKC